MASAAQVIERKPRVLVVGMFDRQFQIVANEYPSLAFDHYKDGSYSEIDGALKRADHVLVITKFVSHAVWDHIDKKDPRVSIFSGLDSLRRLCAGIAAGALFRPSTVLAFPGKTGPYCDYSPLRTAAVGDVFTFYRPDGVPAHLFSQDVHAARDAAAAAGIRTQFASVGGRAEVTVTEVAERVTIKTEGNPVFRLPTVHEQARAFWGDVYCESFRALSYLPSSYHAAAANAAADAWLSFCGEE